MTHLGDLASGHNLEKEEPMETDDDDTLKDLQNKRKFSTFGINPNFEPFADSFGSTLFLT